jgi:hypothetical protein
MNTFKCQRSLEPVSGVEPQICRFGGDRSFQLSYTGLKTGTPTATRTLIAGLGNLCPFPLDDGRTLGWLEELESSFTGSQPAALPYKLQPHLVEDLEVESRLNGCRPSVLPLSLVPRNCGAESGSPTRLFSLED